MSGKKGTEVAAFLEEVTAAEPAKCFISDIKHFAGGGCGPEEVERNVGANETTQWAKNRQD